MRDREINETDVHAFFSSRVGIVFFSFLFPFEEEGLEEKKRRTWQEEGTPSKEAQYINFRR